jgi:hypothetical protein
MAQGHDFSYRFLWSAPDAHRKSVIADEVDVHRSAASPADENELRCVSCPVGDLRKDDGRWRLLIQVGRWKRRQQKIAAAVAQ